MKYKGYLEGSPEHKGQLEGFPEHIVNMMLDNQEAQGNERDVTVFERCNTSGFDWSLSKEGVDYWIQIIVDGDYDTPIPTPTQPLQEFKIKQLKKKKL
jgi:hypothetical protein